MLTKPVPQTVADRLSDSLGGWFLDKEEVKAQDCQQLRDGYWNFNETRDSEQNSDEHELGVVTEENRSWNKKWLI